MRKRLLLLLATWPLLAHADPKYGDYSALDGFFTAAWWSFMLGIALAVAQLLGRLLRWLLGRRFNLWVLSMTALIGCWLGTYRPLDFNRPEPEPVPQGSVLAVSGPSPLSPPPSVQYLAASSAAAVLLTALTMAAIAFWEQRNQYPEQEE